MFCMLVSKMSSREENERKWPICTDYHRNLFLELFSNHIIRFYNQIFLSCSNCMWQFRNLLLEKNFPHQTKCTIVIANFKLYPYERRIALIRVFLLEHKSDISVQNWREGFKKTAINKVTSVIISKLS